MHISVWAKFDSVPKAIIDGRVIRWTGNKELADTLLSGIGASTIETTQQVFAKTQRSKGYRNRFPTISSRKWTIHDRKSRSPPQICLPQGSTVRDLSLVIGLT